MDIDEETAAEYHQTPKQMFIDMYRMELIDYLVNTEREVGGIPVTKDNDEDLFEEWVTGAPLEFLKVIVFEYKN